MSTILQLNHVFKDYSRGKTPVPVLKDICLSVQEGDYIAIMGPSGSGKTTLMNLIGCLDVPTSGEYLLDGKQINTMRDNALAEIRNRYIGFVFQNFYLLPKMTALDNVALPLLYAGVKPKERRRRAKEALEMVGLGDRIHFRPNQLSGGQCQRVAIARAMVTNPKLLLADEPTGALDSASGTQIMELFRMLSNRGVTILMITHERRVAECANTILHILDGALHEDQSGAPAAKPRPAMPEKPEPAPEKKPETADAPEKKAAPAAVAGKNPAPGAVSKSQDDELFRKIDAILNAPSLDDDEMMKPMNDLLGGGAADEAQ